ncbi:MFS transporter [Streptomyces sp. Je 1-369]|uniref:MFS transporter n=1 Tax=Streptomyces sp. Je 1-369 TaxID=2966192 RepID=UPI002285DD7F|nr:MFS transporter [Streptomyces sp. Je 1-369]WAL99250.1 MFS transporter [Streptomyces sp. Je 1-369]
MTSETRGPGSGSLPAPAPAPGSVPGPLTVAVMCLCVTLVVGMVSAVNLAVPALSRSTPHPSAESVMWVVDGYVVFFACLLIPGGALADRLGRKRVLSAGMGLFTAGCVLCAVAPGVGTVIAGRVVSGVGAAAVLPTTLALMVGGAPSHRRPRLVAVWASMTGLAAVLGNVGGGAALQLGSWRALFWCVVPLSVVALVLVLAFSPAPPRHDRPLSVVSAGLLTAGFLSLLSGIVSGPEAGWGSARVLAGFAAAVVLLAAWAVRELRHEHPMLDPRLFAVPVVRAGAVGMALVFLGMFGLFYVNGQYLQYAKGYSPLGAGVRLLPMAGALLLAPRCAVALERRVGPRLTLGSGLAVLAAGLGTVSLVGPSTPYPLYALGATLSAAGCGLATPLLSHGMMSALPAHRAGVGSGLQSLARELGSALGVAVSGSVVTQVFTAGLPAPLHGPDAPTTVPAAEQALAAQELAGHELASADLRHAVVADFTTALDTAMRVLAVLVVTVGALVVAWYPVRRGREA